MAAFFRERGQTLRFIEFMDVGHTNGWRLDDVVPAAEIVALLDEAFGVEPVDASYRGEVAQRWRYRDGRGEVGVIASVTQPFCGDCTRARISAEGKLFTCLFAVRGNDLRALIRSGASDDELAEAVRGIWAGRADRYSDLRSAATTGLRQGRDELHRRLSRPEQPCPGDCPWDNAPKARHAPGTVPGTGPNLAISHPNGGCRHPQARLESPAVSTVVAAGRRHLPRGWADFGTPARDLVRLRRALPARPRRRRPQAAVGRVRARPRGRRSRDAPHAPPLRADAPELRRPAALPRDGRLVDLLELRVHRRRPRRALGLPAPPRLVRRASGTRSCSRT